MTMRVLRPSYAALAGPAADTDRQPDDDGGDGVPDVDPDAGYVILDGATPFCLDDIFLDLKERQ